MSKHERECRGGIRKSRGKCALFLFFFLIRSHTIGCGASSVAPTMDGLRGKGKVLEPSVPIISPVGFILSLEAASNSLEHQLFSLGCEKVLGLVLSRASAFGIMTGAQEMLGACFLRLTEF